MNSSQGGSGTSDIRVKNVNFPPNSAISGVMVPKNNHFRAPQSLEVAQQKGLIEKLSLDPKWEEVINKYTLVEKKGQGSYGCVMKAKSNATGQEVAIKMV